MSVTFTTTLRPAEAKSAMGISVPTEMVEQLGGGKAPLVKVTVNGYFYRSKIAVMGGENLIPFNAERREESGIRGGEPIEVMLELDLEPRTVEVPDDLRAALEAAVLFEAFEKASPSRKKEFVRLVNEAKTPETRSRRIGKVVGELG